MRVHLPARAMHGHGLHGVCGTRGGLSRYVSAASTHAASTVAFVHHLRQHYQLMSSVLQQPRARMQQLEAVASHLHPHGLNETAGETNGGSEAEQEDEEDAVDSKGNAFRESVL